MIHFSNLWEILIESPLEPYCRAWRTISRSFLRSLISCGRSRRSRNDSCLLFSRPSLSEIFFRSVRARAFSSLHGLSFLGPSPQIYPLTVALVESYAQASHSSYDVFGFPLFNLRHPYDHPTKDPFNFQIPPSFFSIFGDISGVFL